MAKHPGQGGNNRLIDSTSPYLLQHAHNPVEWYPWGEEALARAKRENKPIFLSIGYAACHWCHVMEREVFEKPALAALMNEHFVNIKVDREERPDLDDLYMLATQLMSGSGGWPMSVWLTPDLKPFYAGTYFPAEDGYGRPGFRRLTGALADAWKNRRGELEGQAERVVEAIRMHADETGGRAAREVMLPVTPWVRMAVEQMSDRLDEVHGGFGGAPKFPPHQALQFLLALIGETGGGKSALSDKEKGILAEKVRTTLDGMMKGGIYDHVAGGFARYSTDEKWLVPHFEKMLYDSAQLAPIYAAASVVLQNPEYARISRETLDFFLREMCSERGAFYSSLDADSEGEEGKYYVWTIEDVRAAIGGDAELIVEHFGMTPEGNWHETPVERASVLAVAWNRGTLAARHGVPVETIGERLDGLLEKMREYRAKRVRPGLDDKILTSWNGLMVSALAVTGRLLREPKYLEAAHRLIGFLLMEHMEGGSRLLRVSRGGSGAHTDGFLDDRAYLLNGLMDLIESTTPTSLPGTMARRRALELADTLIRDFADEARGGFFYTGPKHEKLFARMKNAADNATPSANGVAIRALLRLAHVSGKEQYREVALKAAAAFEEHIGRRPEYFPTILLGLLEDQRIKESAPGGISPVAPPPIDPLRAPLHDIVSPGDIFGLKVEGSKQVKAGEVMELVLRFTIAGGYHVRAAQDREAFKPVARVRTVDDEEVVNSQDWAFPPVGDGGFEGTVEIRGRCGVKAGVSGKKRLRVTVMAQPCSAVACFPPERVSEDFEVMVG